MIDTTHPPNLADSGRLLGVFPLPVGLLLLPDPGPEGDGGALDRLLRGDASAPLPPAWAFLGPALAGDADAALHLLGEGDEPLVRYDRLVLGADPDLFHALLDDPLLAPDLPPLVRAAGYVHGLCDDPATPAEGLPAEAAATVDMVLAAHLLEQGQVQLAVERLGQAVERVRQRSPVFAAQLANQRAELLAESDPEGAVAELRRALDLSTDARLPGLRADLWLRLGLSLHGLAEGRRDRMLEAVRAYQEALASGLTAESHPQAYAMAQNHLGLAYLSMPMHGQSAQLRQGIAVQSFRKALEIYRPESHPDLWASTQLNLANALQYLPSSHPQENLVQAVELYEQLLGVRDRAREPVGYARLLANQANALAHLGMFAPALQKLDEAHKLFHWHGEPEAARSVLEQVAVIHDQRQKAERPDASEET